MKNGGAAFPCASDHIERKGMTMRQWYKGQAPDQAPSWFKHRSRPRPEQPEIEINGYISCKGVINPEVQARVNNWRRDPCYDLSDLDPKENWTEAELAAMVKYEVTWKERWKAFDAWCEQDLEDRYFQWRGYYADAMIAEDREAEKGEE